MTKKTQLQLDIEKAVRTNPSFDDEQIARTVFKTNHPDAKYHKLNPTKGYVMTVRRRMKDKPPAPNIEAEKTQSFTGGENPDEPFPTNLKIGDIEDPDEPDEPDDPDDPTLDIEYQIDVYAVGTILDLIFDNLANWTSYEGWRLKKDERAKLSTATKPMIDKYLPIIMAQYWTETIFMLTVVTIFGGKYSGYSKHKKKTKEKKLEDGE